MGSAFRSSEVITDESWLDSEAVRSWSVSALTCTLVERAAMGRTMRRGAANVWLGTWAAVALMEGAMVIGVLMVLKPGSETTSVKVPGCGGVTVNEPSPPERKLPSRAPLLSTRSISASGTMAPEGSATTPVMAGAGGGAGALVDARAHAGQMRRMKATRRNMRISGKRYKNCG